MERTIFATKLLLETIRMSKLMLSTIFAVKFVLTNVFEMKLVYWLREVSVGNDRLPNNEISAEKVLISTTSPAVFKAVVMVLDGSCGESKRA